MSQHASFRRGLALGAGLLALAGCTTVGPNYKVPDKAVVKQAAAQAPFAETRADATENTPLPDHWWRLYDDPVLDGLVEQALAANTDLRVASANLAHAREVVTQAESLHDIEGGVTAMATRTRLSGESYLLSEPIPVSTLGSADVGISYQLDLFGRIKRTVEMADASREAVAAVRDVVKVSVAADVARAYVGVCAAGEDLEIAEKTIEVQRHTLEATEKLASGGRISAIDVTQARARLDQAEAVTPIYLARRKAALYRLAYLMGRVPAEYPREAEGCHTIPMVKGVIPVGDGAALLRRRPDIRSAERQLAAATAEIGIATAELYPSVELGAGAGSLGYLKDLGKAAANRWDIMGLITWNFPTKGSRARVRAASAGADAALAHFDGVVLAALRETETSLSTYAHDIDRAQALDEAHDQAHKAMEQVERMRKAGRSPLLVGLGARQTAVSAEAAASEAHIALAEDQINLFLALGGGWQDEAKAPTAPDTKAAPDAKAPAATPKP